MFKARKKVKKRAVSEDKEGCEWTSQQNSPDSRHESSLDLQSNENKTCRSETRSEDLQEVEAHLSGQRWLFYEARSNKWDYDCKRVRLQAESDADQQLMTDFLGKIWRSG